MATDRYLVKAVVHAAQVMAAFHTPGEVLRLRDVVDRTGFNKGTCFRLLYTLRECGFLEKLGENQYRRAADPQAKRRYRIGYASQGQDSSFTREVLLGLIAAARQHHIELIVCDNRYNAKVALRNADRLIREKVDLIIEFQTDEAVAAPIATRYMEANIPFIAIDIPHPGATYFGANNYEAGLIAGRHLGRWTKRNWGGTVDEILLLELSRAGPLPRTRVHAMLAGIKEILQPGPQVGVTILDSDGQFRTALEVVRRHLRVSRSQQVLVGAVNDPSALGALRAFEEAGRVKQCAVVGQNAEPEARAEMRMPRTRLIGSVAYFPEKYGEGLIRVALDILNRQPAPPACFIKHQLITPENVDQFYPNDSLIHGGTMPQPGNRPADVRVL